MRLNFRVNNVKKNEKKPQKLLYFTLILLLYYSINTLNWIFMKDNKIFLGNVKRLDEIVRELEITKSRSDEYVDIKGLSPKYFSNMTLGK